MARIEADELAAREARERLRSTPLTALQTDALSAPLMQPDEDLLATRSGAILNVPAGETLLSGGTVYLTSRRIVHAGRILVSIPLEQVRELSVGGERLLLTLDGGDGMSLDVDQPRLLRVEISAAIAAFRAAQTS